MIADLIYLGCLLIAVILLWGLIDEALFRFRLWQIRRATWRRIQKEIDHET